MSASLGAAACDTDLLARAATPGFPAEFGCWAVGSRVREAGGEASAGRFHRWTTFASIPTGRVHVAAIPIYIQGQQAGFAILLQDLGYIERREAMARTYLLAAF